MPEVNEFIVIDNLSSQDESRQPLNFGTTNVVEKKFDPQETRRILENIKKELGKYAKYGAMLPKPVLIGGLITIWAAFTGLDLAPDIINIVKEGTVNVTVISELVSNVVNSLVSAGGLFAIFKSVNLFKSANAAEENKNDDLAVTVPCVNDSALLSRKDEEIAKLSETVAHKDIVIRALINEITSNPGDCKTASQAVIKRFNLPPRHLLKTNESDSLNALVIEAQRLTQEINGSEAGAAQICQHQGSAAASTTATVVRFSEQRRLLAAEPLPSEQETNNVSRVTLGA